MKNHEYNHKTVEAKWQNYWEKNKSFEADLTSKKEKFYALDMYPYPSGQGLHVGHPEGYTATDIVSRMKWMQGYEVLHPIGWDAFGLPAEQYAVKTGKHPASFTQKNIQNFKKQLKTLGFSFDWSKEVDTTDPNYYKHTQWIFAQLYKKGLAELREIDVNWSPSLNTVLANEEVYLDKKKRLVSERDHMPVEKRSMKQWVLKITAYADRLFSGLDKLDWPVAVKKLQRNWIYKHDVSSKEIKNLHLKDWIFARQRYWGEPFPIVHLENGEIYLLPEHEYPIILPEVKNYTFTRDGKPALAKSKNWVNYKKGELKGKRDVNTMPQWAGSSWYYIAYLLKKKDGTYYNLDSKEAYKLLNKWLPVDLYIGGQEHAVLHLLYARFWHLFLSDIGVTLIQEPFQKLYNQGMILGPDNTKMSKSRGNVINPDDIVKKYGADALRLYEMFMGPLADDKAWTDKGIKASREWLNRVYRFYTKQLIIGSPSDELKKAFNNMVIKVTGYYEELKFNLAISEMMIFLNNLYKFKITDKKIMVGFLQLLSCITPHLAEELNELILKNNESLSRYSWPTLLPVKMEEEANVIVYQLNGKYRGTINDYKLSDSPTEQELFKLISKKFSLKFSRKEVKKIIYVKNKIINVVTH